jgi:hypothetical protein
MNPTILKETTPERAGVTLNADASWSRGQLIGFRFLFLFLLLFIIIDNNGAFPFFSYVLDYPTEALHVIIPWVGKNILNLSYEITVFTNGSGDTTYDYVIVFSIALVSFLGMIVWSALDRERTNYTALLYWLNVAVRFYVGLMLINYGLVKVFKTQFPSPGLNRLTQLYGNSSPMGLAWTFLGFSTGYNIFMGCAEVAAVLLLFRRTVTLGSIICLMTTANVMAVNYFYDVPVKILSTALFLMSAFLMIQNGRPLFDFFIRNTLTKLKTARAVAFNKRWEQVAFGAKALLIGFVFVNGSYESYQVLKKYGHLAPKPHLYGLYKARHFILGSDTIPPLITDKSQWRQMSIQWPGFVRINYMTDSVASFFSELDTIQQTMELSLRTDTTRKFHFKYQNVKNNEFVFQGEMDEQSLQIVFDRYTDVDNEFLLTRRGFNWINEYPFNR